MMRQELARENSEGGQAEQAGGARPGQHFEWLAPALGEERGAGERERGRGGDERDPGDGEEGDEGALR